MSKMGILLMVAAILSVAPFGPAERPGPAAEATAKHIPAVVNGGNAFAFNLYAQLAGKEKGNLFFSPSSVHAALAMTYAGARGRTAEQMAETLHFTLSQQELHPAFAALLKRLNDPRKDRQKKPVYELVVSNALWGQKGYPFKGDFIRLVTSSYGAGLSEMDFLKQPEPSRRKINGWVAEQTREKIKDLIPRGAITTLTRLVLTNAIYFKSNWMAKFRKSATGEGTFHLSADATVQTPLMHQRDRFGYMETDTFQALELPYMYYDLSMLILLPKKVDGITALEKSLTPQNVAAWRKQIKREKVRVTLPKFRYTSQFRLAGTLGAMGMPDAFSPRLADFTGMATVEREFFISEVIHKAFVAVDEEGTEAAAATAVIMPTGMLRRTEPKVFKADHPFVLLIRHRATGSILFLGRVANPEES